MSPRPRSATDEDLIAATQRVVTQLGPHLTLADIGKEAGVSAATLVQRFGSKRALLLKFASLGAEGTHRQFAAIRNAHPDPLDALREIVRCYSHMAPTPEAVSNGLAFLQVDLTDPEFHRFAHAQARAALRALEKVLHDAVKAGQLAPCDTERLAFALHSAIGGAMVAWAVLREGTAEDAILAAVETVLEPRLKPHRTAPVRKQRARG
ncbi:MAG: TetR/AcrR family transcriptional regulator [Acidobacteriota bacterium]|nr:TetR/AcrR family transcriptional regulator [Acidobacteriota bacterium]MDQ3418908.1 TetR/AcrR family transcriptional regulator [Acidobacteriota bacterium]